jgi:hypothetical protein
MIKHLAYRLADQVQLATAAGAGLVLKIEPDMAEAGSQPAQGRHWDPRNRADRPFARRRARHVVRQDSEINVHVSHSRPMVFSCGTRKRIVPQQALDQHGKSIKTFAHVDHVQSEVDLHASRKEAASWCRLLGGRTYIGYLDCDEHGRGDCQLLLPSEQETCRNAVAAATSERVVPGRYRSFGVGGCGSAWNFARQLPKAFSGIPCASQYSRWFNELCFHASWCARQNTSP